MTRRTRKAPPAPPPLTPSEGAAQIMAHAVPLFDQQDGAGANWRLMAGSLFKAALDVLDKLEADERRQLAERVYAGVYERFLASEAGKGGDSGDKAPDGPRGTAQRAFNPKPSLRP